MTCVFTPNRGDISMVIPPESSDSYTTNPPSRESESYDTIVVGAGLAGCATATRLAQRGQRVLLVERSKRAGGRAATLTCEGHQLNLGAHALYNKGPAWKLLNELGVPWTGTQPKASGNEASLSVQGRPPISALPLTPLALATCQWLSWRQKWRLMRLLSGIVLGTHQHPDELTLATWLEQHLSPEDQHIEKLLLGLFRLTNYAHAPEYQSAGPALQQLQHAVKAGVWYVDGGWQTLVDGMLTRFQEAQGQLILGATVTEVLLNEGQVTGIRMADGSQHSARHICLSLPPQQLTKLFPEDAPFQGSLARLQETLQPITASCLDLVLEELPFPQRRFVMGLDAPLYYSLHSAYAKLHQEGATQPPSPVVHLLRYHHPDEDNDPKGWERELETWLDTLQPGWQTKTLVRRFLPRMTVSYGLVTEAFLKSLEEPLHAPAGLHLLGAWRTAKGMLADAAMASAEEVTQHILTKSLIHAR